MAMQSTFSRTMEGVSFRRGDESYDVICKDGGIMILGRFSIGGNVYVCRCKVTNAFAEVLSIISEQGAPPKLNSNGKLTQNALYVDVEEKFLAACAQCRELLTRPQNVTIPRTPLDDLKKAVMTHMPFC